MSNDDDIRTSEDPPSEPSRPLSDETVPEKSASDEAASEGSQLGASDLEATPPSAPAEAAAEAIVRAQLGATAATTPATDAMRAVHQARFAPLHEGTGDGRGTNLDLLLDVTVTVTAEMGSKSLPLEQVLELKPGSVVELDRSADEPIDLLVNGKPVARGEVVVIEDQFGVRITEILDAEVGRAKKERKAAAKS